MFLFWQHLFLAMECRFKLSFLIELCKQFISYLCCETEFGMIIQNCSAYIFTKCMLYRMWFKRSTVKMCSNTWYIYFYSITTYKIVLLYVVWFGVNLIRYDVCKSTDQVWYEKMHVFVRMNVNLDSMCSYSVCKLFHPNVNC